MSSYQPLTPMEVEARLVTLSNELDLATDELIVAEREYHAAKVDERLALAGARLDQHRSHRSTPGSKLTVGEREDEAEISCEREIRALAIASATVRAARDRVNTLRSQIDIARSLGTSVRSSIDTTY